MKTLKNKHGQGFVILFVLVLLVFFGFLFYWSLNSLSKAEGSNEIEKINSPDSLSRESEVIYLKTKDNSCPFSTGPDFDQDKIIDYCDNCHEHYNPKQEDFDYDGIGDVCDDLYSSGVRFHDDDSDEDDSGDDNSDEEDECDCD